MGIPVLTRLPPRGPVLTCHNHGLNQLSRARVLGSLALQPPGGWVMRSPADGLGLESEFCHLTSHMTICEEIQSL